MFDSQAAAANNMTEDCLMSLRTCEEVRNLFAFSARYTGPDTTQTAANDDMSEEKIHEGVLNNQYTLLEVNSRKGHNTRLKPWY